jgi:sigma-B regulation protein RsbU (phosphoserine phosphatase)
MPHFPGWEIAAMWEPAREVSGDYYDFVPAAKELDLIIGDVSDKGMPAALLMVQTRSIIRANLSPAKTMADGVTRSNELICASSANDMFVTMACVRLDAKSGKIICVNAGHNRPLICRARDGELSELPRTGIALGILAGQHYDQRRVRLQRGDFVVLYTDGVTDAMNPAGEMFGEERLREIVLGQHKSSAADLIAAFKSELEKFIGSAAPADDITIVAAKKI